MQNAVVFKAVFMQRLRKLEAAWNQILAQALDKMKHQAEAIKLPSYIFVKKFKI